MDFNHLVSLLGDVRWVTALNEESSLFIKSGFKTMTELREKFPNDQAVWEEKRKDEINDESNGFYCFVITDGFAVWTCSYSKSDLQDSMKVSIFTYYLSSFIS
jgi:hypothetical protein